MNPKFISNNLTVRSTLDKAVSVIGADLAWKRGQLGVGIGIAVIDSGIDAGEDLKGGGKTKKTVVSCAAKASSMAIRKRKTHMATGRTLPE